MKHLQNKSLLVCCLSNLLHYASTDFIGFSCSLSDEIFYKAGKGTLTTHNSHVYIVLHLSCIEYKFLQELQDKETQSPKVSPGHIVTLQFGLQDLLWIFW